MLSLSFFTLIIIHYHKETHKKFKTVQKISYYVFILKKFWTITDKKL